MSHLLPALVLLCLGSVITLAEECKVKLGTRPYDMVESLLMAQVVVYGRYLNHTADGDMLFMVRNFCVVIVAFFHGETSCFLN